MRLCVLTGLMHVAVLTSACTSQQMYDSAAGWRHHECDKLLDDAARARCIETASKDYDTYRKEQDQLPQ
jgi:hypothetical protein